MNNSIKSSLTEIIIATDEMHRLREENPEEMDENCSTISTLTDATIIGDEYEPFSELYEMATTRAERGSDSDSYMADHESIELIELVPRDIEPGELELILENMDNSLEEDRFLLAGLTLEDISNLRSVDRNRNRNAVDGPDEYDAEDEIDPLDTTTGPHRIFNPLWNIRDVPRRMGNDILQDLDSINRIYSAISRRARDFRFSFPQLDDITQYYFEYNNTGLSEEELTEVLTLFLARARYNVTTLEQDKENRPPPINRDSDRDRWQ
ncbi:hypothetical protein G9P44_002440 [Scheffersomyces stipitis]|nr:hypothetical protein G9P44_002440 [Scheffersomyces stipitis]